MVGELHYYQVPIQSALQPQKLYRRHHFSHLGEEDSCSSDRVTFTSGKVNTRKGSGGVEPQRIFFPHRLCTLHSQM